MPRDRKTSASEDAFAFARKLQKRNKRLASLARQDDKKVPEVCPMCRRRME